MVLYTIGSIRSHIPLKYQLLGEREKAWGAGTVLLLDTLFLFFPSEYWGLQSKNGFQWVLVALSLELMELLWDLIEYMRSPEIWVRSCDIPARSRESLLEAAIAIPASLSMAGAARWVGWLCGTSSWLSTTWSGCLISSHGRASPGEGNITLMSWL